MSTTTKLSEQVNKAIASIKDSETFAVPLLVLRLEKLASADPSDYTVLALQRVLSKLEENHKNFISRALFRELYTKHYVSGTRFAEHFASELGDLPKGLTPKYAATVEKAPIGAYDAADPILANALSSILDHEPVRMYSKDAVKAAVGIVNANLNLWDLGTSKLNVVAGNEQFLVVQADYDTPKGKTSVFVPVEVVKGKALAPMLFMANSGPRELNNANLKEYLISNAGARLDVKPQSIIDVLTSTFEKKATIGEVALAAIKIKSDAAEYNPFFADSVLGNTMEPEVTNAIVELPKAGEFQTFADKFETPLGIANFKFGVDKVNLGRDTIVRVLAGIGVKSPSISVVGVDGNTIGYAVSLNDRRVSFNVPVTIASNRVLTPELLVCNGAVKPLTKQSIAGLLVSGETDTRASVATSGLYGLRTSDLIDSVRTAVRESNYAKAEDALGVLASMGDTTAYNTALTVYTDGLSGNGEIVSKCSRIVQTKTSSAPVCGHTGLPLNKVYQDANGACAPLYHRELNENYVPAAINTYRVFE